MMSGVIEAWSAVGYRRRWVE